MTDRKILFKPKVAASLTSLVGPVARLENLHPVSAVYPTRLNVPAFVDRLLGLYDHRRLRLFNRNHSSISIEESVPAKESTTVKALHVRLLSGWMRNK